MRHSRFCSPKTITCATLGKAFFTSMKRAVHACLSRFILNMMVLAWCVAISVFLAGDLHTESRVPSAQERAKALLETSWHISHRGRSEHASVRLTHILRPSLWHSCHHASAPSNRCILLLPDIQRPNHPIGQPLHVLRFQKLIGDTILTSCFFALARKSWCHTIYPKELSALLTQGSFLNPWRSNVALYSCSD